MAPKWVTKARALREGGATYNEVAKQCGVSRTAVMYWLLPNVRKAHLLDRQIRSHGKAQCSTGCGRPVMAQGDTCRLCQIRTKAAARDFEIVRLYQAGVTYASIAQVVGCGRSTAVKAVRDAKVTRRRDDKRAVKQRPETEGLGHSMRRVGVSS